MNYQPTIDNHRKVTAEAEAKIATIREKYQERGLYVKMLEPHLEKLKNRYINYGVVKFEEARALKLYAEAAKDLNAKVQQYYRLLLDDDALTDENILSAEILKILLQE